MTRFVFAAFIAIAVVMAPVQAALASLHATSIAGMADCDRAAVKDCNCCDKAQCIAATCQFHCFAFVGDVPGAAVLLMLGSALYEPAEPQRPPDRSDGP